MSDHKPFSVAAPVVPMVPVGETVPSLPAPPPAPCPSGRRLSVAEESEVSTASPDALQFAALEAAAAERQGHADPLTPEVSSASFASPAGRSSDSLVPVQSPLSESADIVVPPDALARPGRADAHAIARQRRSISSAPVIFSVLLR